jgi:hypothetical protein
MPVDIIGGKHVVVPWLEHARAIGRRAAVAARQLSTFCADRITAR